MSNLLKASIIFLTYNQEKYVEEALLSALAQDHPNLEIIIADDGSTDRTLAVIEALLAEHPRGHVARILPAEPNMGLVKNWNRATQAADGDFFVAMAGDDISAIARTSAMAAIFVKDPEVMAIFSQVSVIDASGAILHQNREKREPKYACYRRTESRIALDFWSGAPVLGACGAYRRPLRDEFGSILHAHSEDDPYVYRALLIGAVAYTPQNLVSWRWHGLNLSMGKLRDETSPAEVLRRRAMSFVGRKDACRQHELDLRSANTHGRLSPAAYELEVGKLAQLVQLYDLGYYTLAPGTSAGTWLAVAFRLLRHAGCERRTLAYVLRSAIKRFAPVSLRLKYSRPST
jgi:glycosyltransferase involved in cell wall biosynthesis